MLKKRLESARRDRSGVLVVLDGVSSDGDIAPLDDIVMLARSNGARVMVDEAHALGVLGSSGAGVADLFGVEDQVDLRMATFSKSLASCGGVIAGSHELIEYLRIAARPFIFTAAGVPAAIGAALQAVRIARSEEGRQLAHQARANASHLRRGLLDSGFQLHAQQRRVNGNDVEVPVLSVVIGEDWKAVLLWKALYDAGVFMGVAIAPAVRPGGALLRMSVMATHEPPVLDDALAVIANAKQAFEREHGALPNPKVDWAF